jgi:hypothetical protein
MTDWNRVIEASQSVLNVLNSHLGGKKDDVALSEIQAAAIIIEMYSDGDVYISEKIVSCRSFSETYYSPRKWQKYGHPHYVALEKVKSIIYAAASNVASWAKKRRDSESK